MVPLLIGSIVLLLLALAAVVAFLVLDLGGTPGGAPVITQVVPRETAAPAMLTPEPASIAVGEIEAGWQPFEGAVARHPVEAWGWGSVTTEGGF
jgi:hypothetical protein